VGIHHGIHHVGRFMATVMVGFGDIWGYTSGRFWGYLGMYRIII
jgi:hypothetical protein